MRTALILLALLLCGASPASVIDAAVLALARVPPADRQYTRYLALWPGEGDEQQLAVMRFWLNSLTMRRKVVEIAATPEGLLQIDLRAMGWKAEVWEQIAKADPYFAVSVIDGKGVINRGWIDPTSYIALSKDTHSFLPVLRADWFLARTSLDRGGQGFKAGFYSDVLGLPKTEKELFDLLGSKEQLGQQYLGRGGAVLQSEVALHNRELQLFPSLIGRDHAYLWRSLDTQDESKGKSVLEEFVGTIQADGKEFVFSLPNGLQGYYLSDGKGNQAAEVPTSIAQDRAAVGDVTVLTPRRCVTCHPRGVRHFNDRVAELALSPKVGLAVISKGKKDDRQRELLEDYYLSDLGRTIAAHQTAFDAAVLAACGLPAEKVSAAYGGEFDRYFWGRIDRATAIRETGIPEDEIDDWLKRSGNPHALNIMEGGSTGRETWERAWHQIMKAGTYEWEQTDGKTAVPAVRIDGSDHSADHPGVRQ